MSNPMAPALPELTPRAEVALLARILFREGYDDRLAGHITLRLDDDAVYGDYPGPVNEPANARDIAKVMGSANVCLLANHGVLIVGRPMRPEVAAEFGEMFNHVPFPGLFDAMARRELRVDPTILDE